MTSLKDASWTLLSQIGRLLMQGAYFVIAARVLGAKDLGIFAGIGALVAVVAPFSGCGSGNLIVKYGATDPLSVPKYFADALYLLLISSIILGGSLVLLAPKILGPIFELRTISLLIVSEVFAYRAVDIAGQALQAIDRLDQAAWVNLLSGAARLCSACIYACCFSRSGVATFASIYAVFAVSCAVCSCIIGLKILGMPRLQILPRRLAGQCKEGLAYSIGVAARSIYGDIDKTMLARMDSPEVNGLYSAAYRVISLAFAPIQAVVLSRNTRMFRSGANGIHAAVGSANRLAPLLICYALVLGACIYVFSPLATFILGPHFFGVSSVLRGLAILPVIQAIHYLYGDVLMGAGYQRVRSLCQLGIAIVNVTLNLWLIPALSWRGAVISTLACEGLLSFSMLVLICWYKMRCSVSGSNTVVMGQSGMLAVVPSKAVT